MATNKNAAIRYQTLDKCFRNPGRKYYMEDLIEACNEALVDIAPNSSGGKRRQIYEDIKFMQDSRRFDVPNESFKNGRNYKLESVILAFGEKIEVLEPKQLRKVITSRIKELNKKYNLCR